MTARVERHEYVGAFSGRKHFVAVEADKTGSPWYTDDEKPGESSGQDVLAEILNLATQLRERDERIKEKDAALRYANTVIDGERDRAETAEKKLADLARKAEAVMDSLAAFGGSIVPHLLDTDENAGERLRAAVIRAREKKA